MNSLRNRLAAVAFVVMFAVLTVAAVVLVRTLRSNLVSETDAAMSATAIDLAGSITVADQSDEALLVPLPGDTELFAAVIDFDADGEPGPVTHNSEVEPPVDELVRLSRDRRGENGMVFDAPDLLEEFAGQGQRIVFAESEGGSVVVAVRSQRATDDTVRGVRNQLLVAVPVLALATALLVWWLATRALRPVERIRADVEAFGATDLDRRVTTGGQPAELHRLADTMNSMLDRIETAQERQQRFAADAAHELRSPLASIAAQLDVDAAHPGSADTGRTQEIMRRQIDRLQGTVDHLLVLARSGADESPMVRLDLDDVVRSEVAAVAASAEVEVTVSASSGAEVRGHEPHVRRLVQNLVTNAVRHAEHRVSVTAHTGDRSSVLTVDDDGPGVAPADRARIFDRFVRLDEARARHDGGSGLGLALVRELAQQHGAVVTVDDSPLGGARFEIRFPPAG